MNKIKKEQGFTLIELLVSVAIVGILASISVQNYKEYETYAKRAQGKYYMHHLITAFEGRDDAGQNLTGNTFRTANLYFRGTWTYDNMTDKDDLIPGFPELPNNKEYYIMAREANPATVTSDWQRISWFRVAHCKGGWYHDVRYRKGHSREFVETFTAGYDRC